MNEGNLIPAKKGERRNPAGRPAGSKNKATIFKEICRGQFEGKVEDALPKVLDTLFKKAEEGDMTAIKMIVDRIIPVSKPMDINQGAFANKGVSIVINTTENENETISEPGSDRAVQGESGKSKDERTIEGERIG